MATLKKRKLSVTGNRLGYSVLEILVVLSIIVLLLTTVFLISMHRARQLKNKVRDAEIMRTQGVNTSVSDVKLGQKLESYRHWLDGKVYAALSREEREQPMLFRIAKGVSYDTGSWEKNNALARSLIKQAILKTRSGDLATARRLLNEASILNPLDPVIYGELARVGYLMQDLDYALKQITSALEINPDFADAFLVRARVYLSQGQLEDAWKDLQKSATLKHTDPEYFLVLSEYHLKKGHLDEAQENAKMFESLMDNAWKVGG